MKLSVLLAGVTWFQTQLIKFAEKSEKQNTKDINKINDIQSKIDVRKVEITKAKNISKNISKLLDE